MSACATGQSGKVASSPLGGPETSADKPPEIVCTMERSVGSNIPERVCRYVSDIEAERARQQREAMTRTPVQMRSN